jgi:NAD+ synthase
VFYTLLYSKKIILFSLKKRYSSDDIFIFMNSSKNVLEALVHGLQVFMHNTNAEKAIIGLSGGVDSAVTFSIAVRAIGAQKVIPVLLPFSPFSSEQNINDAKMLTEMQGAPHRLLFLDDFIHAFQKNLPETQNKHVLGNVLARLRMTILYSIANAENGIVLGTCNKTETLLGYETKFGDGGSDVSVIGGLWKTEVWEIAKALSLPEIFITKTPSAELWENQTDEGELGFSYQEADSILQQWERGEILPDSPQVAKVLSLIEKNRHKNIGIPVLAKEYLPC